MKIKRSFSPTEIKNTGIILVVTGMIFSVTTTKLTASPINIATITALLMSITGAGLLGAYYYKTDRKQLTMRLYMAAAMLLMLLVYYFAIARV
jgi:uncharacterized membrane protein